LAKAAAAGALPPPHREDALVLAAMDGDTLVLADGRHLRLIGVNAPELGKDGEPDEPFARAAHTLVANLTAGRRVRLEFEQESTDRYGRWLAHVELPDGQNLQEILLRQGLAFAVAIPPNLARLAVYFAAEEEARRAGRGIWGHPAYAPRPAEGVAKTGFQLVRGTIQRIGRGRHAYYFDLAPRLTLVVDHEDWVRYFGGGDPARWRGRAVIARGWVTPHRDKLSLRLRHPAMLTLVD
jgi:endonuclease YncB( thermonuclease family)